MTTRQLDPLQWTLQGSTVGRAVLWVVQWGGRSAEGSTVGSTVREEGSFGSTRAVLEESCDGGSSLCSRVQDWPTGEEQEQRGVEELGQKGGLEDLEIQEKELD